MSWRLGRGPGLGDAFAGDVKQSLYAVDTSQDSQCDPIVGTITRHSPTGNAEC